MGSICWENPHFIDNILAGSGPLLELLFQLITNAATLPNNINALIHVLNFLHSVSLKEGPVRDQRLPKLLPAFLHQVFTHDKFYDCLESKKLTSLFSALLKFHAEDRCLSPRSHRARDCARCSPREGFQSCVPL